MNASNIESGERPTGQANLIKTARYRPDFENPDDIPRKEAARIVREKLLGIWFINPIGSVHSSCDSPEFLDAVRKHQAEWFRLLSRQFGNGWRGKKERATCERPSYDAAYEFDGVVVCQQVILPFAIWHFNTRHSPARDRVT